MRNAEDTVVLVTGATDGLGRGVAERLAATGATVHLHGRDADRVSAAASEIERATGNGRVEGHLADLASLDQVRSLAEEVQGSTDHLHVLINNAGIGSGRPESTRRQESADGLELRFAVNYLAGFALTLRLLPLLQGSAPARVVNVASLGQAPLDFSDPMLERSYDGRRAYSQSKLAQITFGMELADRLEGSGVTVNSLHPSTLMPTKMVLEQYGSSVDRLEDGIEATVRLAISPELEQISGRFFDRRSESAAHPQAYDAEARRRLWELSAELTGEAL